MNKETIDLINQLAAQVGTVGSNLWAALIKQAPITAATDAITLAVCWYLFSKGVSKTKKMFADDHDAAPPAAITLVVIGIILGVITLVNVEWIVAGFFNPDYWALHQVTSFLKSK
jgi:hypothetical protein